MEKKENTNLEKELKDYIKLQPNNRLALGTINKVGIKVVAGFIDVSTITKEKINKLKEL